MSDNFRKEFKRIIFCRSQVKVLAHSHPDYSLKYSNRDSKYSKCNSIERKNTATEFSIININSNAGPVDRIANVTTNKNTESTNFQEIDEKRQFLSEPTYV
jgi:hypothetical protein